MALHYFRGDELGSWEGTVTINGTAPDLTSGWTFTATLSKAGETTLTKTSGITGSTGGAFTVVWAAGELNRAQGDWRAQMTGRRVSDHAEFTVQDTVSISPRTLAEV